MPQCPLSFFFVLNILVGDIAEKECPLSFFFVLNILVGDIAEKEKCTDCRVEEL
jgi:hypothetical protein